MRTPSFHSYFAALFLSLAPMTLAVTACSSDSSGSAKDERRLELARSVRGFVEAGDYNALFASCDETMKSQLDAAAFQQFTSIASSLGAYQSETSISEEGPGKVETSGRTGWNVILKCQYQNGVGVYSVTIDDRNLVAGLHLKAN